MSTVNEKGITVLSDPPSPAIEYVIHLWASHTPSSFVVALANPVPSSIVFVHGFTGHPKSTWTLKNARYGVSGDQTVPSKPTEFVGSNLTPFTTASASTTIPKRPSETSSDKTTAHDGRPSKIRRIIPGRASRVPQEHKDSPTTTPKRDFFLTPRPAAFKYSQCSGPYIRI